MSYVVVTDPAVVEVTQAIWEDMMHPSAPKLGRSWRIIIERDGTPAAEVIRTPDTGITIGFYTDEREGHNAIGPCPLGEAVGD